MAEEKNKTVKPRSFRSEEEKAANNLARLEQYKQQLKNDQRFMDYAAGFNTVSVESFIEDFASRKVRWMEWGSKFAEWKQRDDLQWQDMAAELLKEIQQKKLFDLQCLWRAEKFTDRQIETGYDFIYWSTNIMACPLLGPVTEEEAALYHAYMNSGSYQTMSGFMHWQHHKELKRFYENGSGRLPYPEWYSYYDTRKGTSSLLSLPDIRGEKEQFYISLAEAEEKREGKGKTGPANHVAPVKPALDYTKPGFMERFVKTFDTPETYRYFKAMDDTTKHNDEDISEAIELLSQAETLIPIGTHNDWKEAVQWSAAELCRQKCSEVFMAVYDEYKLRIDNKLDLQQQISMMSLFTALDGLQLQIYKRKILRGRKLNGEPEDFNF
jgi:hypothetical protein